MSTNVIAEITITKASRGHYEWSLFTAGTGNEAGANHGTHRDLNGAIWSAVAELRRDDQRSGAIAIYSLDGKSVARVPLWAVPGYDHLEWEPAAVAIDLERTVTDFEPTLVDHVR